MRLCSVLPSAVLALCLLLGLCTAAQRDGQALDEDGLDDLAIRANDALEGAKGGGFFDSILNILYRPAAVLVNSIKGSGNGDANLPKPRVFAAANGRQPVPAPDQMHAPPFEPDQMDVRSLDASPAPKSNQANVPPLGAKTAPTKIPAGTTVVNDLKNIKDFIKGSPAVFVVNKAKAGKTETLVDNTLPSSSHTTSGSAVDDATTDTAAPDSKASPTSEATTPTAPSTVMGENGTVTVNVAAEMNTTTTIGNPESPGEVLTPVPEPTNAVIEDVSYRFLDIEANATSYVLGAMLPLTIMGKPWLGGVQYLEAFKCQLNILNSNSRILPQSMITYLAQNTDVTVGNATQQAFLLQQKNVFMSVGPAYDPQVSPVGLMYAPTNLAFVSFEASSVGLANSTVFPSFFRTIPSDTFQARSMAETMRLFGWSFVAALFTTDAYGTSGRTAFISQTGRQRIKVTCTNSIQPGSTSGLSSFANCVATSEASVVLLWMDEENAANVLSFLYRNATNTRLTFIASDRWARITDPQVFNTTVVARTGSSFPLSFIEGTLGFMPQIGQLGQYQACASVVSPENTNYTEFMDVWETSFKCKHNASDTLPICPPDVEERTFGCRCRGDESFASLPIDPLVNYVQDAVSIMYNALDSLFNPSRCAKLKAPDLCDLDLFTPFDYVDALSLVSITGLTGSIQFNVTQPDRRRSNFDIYQYRSDGVPEQIGFWNITGPFLAKNLLSFKTGDSEAGTSGTNSTTGYPVSILVPDTTDFGSSFWTVAVAVLAGLAIFAALVILAIFTVFGRSRVVRRTNLLWLWLMFGGVILVLVSLILWTVGQTTFVCTLKSILGMLGFSLITACVVVKVERIFRVLINTGDVSMILRTPELLLVVTIVSIPNIVLILCYLFAGGELPQAVVTQSSVDNTYVFISCVPKDANFNDLIVGIFIGYNLLIMLISTVFLLLARNLQTAYQEAEFLFLVLLDFLILSVIMIPLYYTVGDRRGSTLQSFLLRSLAVLFGMIMTIALISYPKLYAIFTKRKAKKRREGEASMAGTGAAAGYAEVPTTEEEEESDFTSASTTSKPRFISQTYTHKSAGGSSGTMPSDRPAGTFGTSTGSGTPGTSSGMVRRSSASKSSGGLWTSNKP